MAHVLEFRLPDLGEGLTEAEIVRWLVAVGDVVAIDQPVVEVETAKAMVEVPCPYGGVVTARFGEEGTELPVGAPLLTVAVDAPGGSGGAGRGARTGGEAAPTAPAASSPVRVSAAETSALSAAVSGTPSSSGTSSSSPSAEASGNVLVGYGTGAPSARRRRVRPSLTGGGSPASRPVGPGGPAVAKPIARTNGMPLTGPVPVVSPLVRRLARESGLDLRQLTGSGRNGLILRADVDRAIRQRAGVAGSTASAPASAPASPVRLAQAGASRVPLRGVRGAVADKLSRSRHEIPDATCWVDADATELMAARAAMNATGGVKISVPALLARICVAALARHPELNSTVDTESREIVRLPEIHLGFAAQTDRGLVVPVVRDAGARSTESLSADIARLTEAGRTGTLTPADLTGGTFTLNNYGVFGVDGSTPIINHPEAAMLGVGRIVPKPWVHEGELSVRQVVQLSLTFDHRVCDGGTAGGFLRYVADCVEQPALLLRSL